MRIAVGADAQGTLVDTVIADLRDRDIDVIAYGAPADGSTQWASIGRAVGEAVATGAVERGIVCCWTGTGVAIAANKVAGVRAALCADAVTAQGARRWNDANVLALSMRAVSPAIGREILAAFLTTPVTTDEDERAEIAKLR